jgi:hypothetical protein
MGGHINMLMTQVYTLMVNCVYASKMTVPVV